jgi:hypothetical protein
VIDPHAVGTRHPDPAIRALVAFTIAVTERPWSLSSRDLAAMRVAGFADAATLHALLQAANFGHLNRIADAVGIEADYPDRFGAPHVEPATPPYLWPLDPPDPAAAKPLQLADRENAVELYGAWRAHVLDRTTALDPRRRAVIAHAVAVRIGDRGVAETPPADELDHALVELADLVTLAPWRLGPAAYTRVRALGLADDAGVFEAIATAASCTAFSRIATVLAAFAR